MIDRAEASDPRLLSMLSRHPHVREAVAGGGPGLRFRQGDWQRSISIADPTLAVAGLVEIMDNNPLVCADAVSVPDPLSTLALIALGPLVRAGIVADRPTVLANASGDEATVDAFLSKEGWNDGATLSIEEMDFGSVLAATVIAAVQTPERLEDIDDLYGESFGRSFFVRRDEESDWDVRLVDKQPYALYRLRIAPDRPQSLLTVQVMADKDGKCGAAQVVHCMNVMAGFEETVGISG